MAAPPQPTRRARMPGTKARELMVLLLDLGRLLRCPLRGLSRTRRLLGAPAFVFGSASTLARPTTSFSRASTLARSRAPRTSCSSSCASSRVMRFRASSASFDAAAASRSMLAARAMSSAARVQSWARAIASLACSSSPAFRKARARPERLPCARDGFRSWRGGRSLRGGFERLELLLDDGHVVGAGERRERERCDRRERREHGTAGRSNKPHETHAQAATGLPLSRQQVSAPCAHASALPRGHHRSTNVSAPRWPM